MLGSRSFFLKNEIWFTFDLISNHIGKNVKAKSSILNRVLETIKIRLIEFKIQLLVTQFSIPR